MKSLTTLLVVAVIVFLYQSVAQIKIRAPTLSPLPLDSTNFSLGSPSQPLGRLSERLSPLLNSTLEKPPENFQSGQLPTGVYETKPYAGIVVVPGREHDDCSVLHVGNARNGSAMPMIHPHIEAIPVPPA